LSAAAAGVAPGHSEALRKKRYIPLKKVCCPTANEFLH
jgi:hypothetical protein